MNNYVSIKRVLERVYRHPFIDFELNMSDVIELTGQILKLYGINEYYKDKVCTLTIEDYKAELPTDMLAIQLIKHSDDHVVFKYTGDPFFMNLHCEDSLNLICCESIYTYKLNENYIFTSEKEGNIDIAYKAIPLDEDGYPKIPDDERFLRALEWEIVAFYAYQLKLSEKMSMENFLIVTGNASKFKRNCIGEKRIPTSDRMEYWLHTFKLRLLPKINHHSNMFKYSQESITNHNTNNFNQGVQ